MGVEGTGRVVNPKIHIQPVDCDCGNFVHKTEEDKPVVSICTECKKRYTVVHERGKHWLEHSEKTYDFTLKETARNEEAKERGII